MIRTAILICAASASVALTSPVLAQRDSRLAGVKGARTDAQFANLVSCAVRDQKAEAARLLDIEPGTKAGVDGVLELLRDAPFCGNPTGTWAPSMTWRGAVAEMLYLNGWGRPASARPDWLSKPGYEAYDVAQCAAERAPAAADRVVRAKRRSAEEAAAVAALLPALRGCGNGRKVDFDRVTIHGMVAEGLYRAQGGSPVAVGKQ